MIHRHLLRDRLRYQQRLKQATVRPEGQEQLKRTLKKLRAQPGMRSMQDQKVVILGAGVAGLACGYELAQLGVEVVLLEAEPEHVGGRVRTHRAAGGLHAELGAMRIPASHDLTNGYIDEFGLETRPFLMSNDEAFTYLRKNAFKVGDISGTNETRAMDLFDLSTAEREMGYGGMWEAAVLDVLEELTAGQVSQLYADELTDSTVIGLDHKALATSLHDAGLSREASEYVMTMMGLETALPIALTEHLREEHDEVWLGAFCELVGGTDELATALHQALDALQPGKVKQGCEVIRLGQTTSKAQAIYRDPNGDLLTEEGDWVICTIPLGVLNRLDIQSAFSSQRLRAIQGVNYDPSSKVIGRSPHRWWESADGIYGGGSMYDTQMGSTWYPADNTAEDADITNSESLFLASYTWGQLARRVATIPADQLDDVMRQELGHIHQSIRDTPSLYQTEIRWAWDQVPTQSGAYAFFMPGEQYRFYQDMVGPDGRIFLTGEHVSHTHSWIQGALESAIRTVDDITTAVGA